MKILLICTAHNSLSQRLSLALAPSHDVTVEYALSDGVMISAVALANPDLIICPFLTTLVPKQIYESHLTLIVHPGPPGDAGPSALDWVLMGDDGTIDDSQKLLKHLSEGTCLPGRTHWGVTVLQAIEEFDAGPVWAFDQFPIDIDEPGLTKSEIYRGPITRGAVAATLAAISRVQHAAAKASKIRDSTGDASLTHNSAYSPTLKADPRFRESAVSDGLPFQGGRTHHRPLLKAAERDFDLLKHTSQGISRRIRCGDSQPGVLTKIFGQNLYVYGGIVDETVDTFQATPISIGHTKIIATRAGAVCIATVSDGRAIWITHIRKPKAKTDRALHPKTLAVFGLQQLGVLDAAQVHQLDEPLLGWLLSPLSTFQEIWIDFEVDINFNRVAYLYFNFYNGAMDADQCSRLVEAMDYIVAQSTAAEPIQAVVLMSGSYFSNGIALNVIEASEDPATESWLSINKIDDVCQYLLRDFPAHKILTFAAIRGNAAAGGVALATCCDFAIAGSDVVLSPAYRAIGLYGSEFHSLSYHGRCGKRKATEILRSMTPMSPLDAREIGLIDFVFPGTGKALEDAIRYHVTLLLQPKALTQGYWKTTVDTSPASLARARAEELGEMRKDFWGARAPRYHTRRFGFVRKIKPLHTPLRFAKHRRYDELHGVKYDEEELDSFDSAAAPTTTGAVGDSEPEYFKANKRGSVVRLVTEKTTASLTLASRAKATDSCIFPCYYKPIDAEEPLAQLKAGLLTPPVELDECELSQVNSTQ